LIKALYIQTGSTKTKPCWTLNIHLIIKKMKGRREKEIFSGDEYQWEGVQGMGE
jgi:hypothetical protein